MPRGQCHCGAVSYEMPAETRHRALCHCGDCRRHAGAPAVAWGLVGREQLKVEGETKAYASSEHGQRHFCPECGTGLFYTNEAVFPGGIDVQIATLDNPDELNPEVQCQLAEGIGWMHWSRCPSSIAIRANREGQVRGRFGNLLRERRVVHDIPVIHRPDPSFFALRDSDSACRFNL